LNELALFAGAGGGILGGKLLGWKTVCAVEREPYCIEVLLRRQEEQILEAFPIWDDVRTFDGTAWRGKVDIVTAGFPCQPFSVAGKKQGKDDERNMWPDTIRIVREVRPEWVLLENVPGLLVHEYSWDIVGEIAEAGFDCAWDIVSAAETGALHRRQRWWCLCHSKCNGRIASEKRGSTKETVQEEQGRQEPTFNVEGTGGLSTSKANVANASKARRKGLWKPERIQKEFCLPICSSEDVADSECQRGAVCGVGSFGNDERGGEGRKVDKRGVPANDSGKRWPVEPDVGRVAYGVANRVDRLKAIGNGQVPRVVATAFDLLK